ncbi:ATP-binding protein [Sphaerisporangium perillae]|uniref:ATP-binding protein n=1 Tax=Sphaerisporangium perillae TaxID=2935860 RepID=UPI00200C08EB|nr:ATP-binding protein [Sphaerisporangium perillae]
MAPDTLKEIRLPSDPESAARARAEVRDWLGEEHPAYEPVRLAVSELITNAVRHARHQVAGGTGSAERAPLVLRLAVDGDRLRVEVTDRGLSAGIPRIRVDQALLLAESIQVEPAFLLGEGGRGLAIVDMLSEGNWGFHANPEGPGWSVWCAITTEPPDLDSEHPRQGSIRTL